jgi:hypothetical protein
LGNGVTVAHLLSGYAVEISHLVLQTPYILIRLFPATSETFAKLFSLSSVSSRLGVAIRPAKIAEWNARASSRVSTQNAASILIDSRHDVARNVVDHFASGRPAPAEEYPAYADERLRAGVVLDGLDAPRELLAKSSLAADVSPRPPQQRSLSVTNYRRILPPPNLQKITLVWPNVQGMPKNHGRKLRFDRFGGFEHVSFNHGVEGSSPSALTMEPP